EASSGSEAQKLALEKWQQLSLAQAQTATTPEQARWAYRTAPSGSEAQKLAMEKWLSFCQTLKQAREAYKRAPSGSEAEKLAIIKMIELAN
ncbi:hypothetical protein HZA71_02635, partial [Candidatus Falkowbacteria bacterium]|nr:hypothetical protein [Candidatus Falkowbacteria bacterium]